MIACLFWAGCTLRIEPHPPSTSPLPLPRNGKGTAGLNDPYYPQLGNGGYDVQHYTIDLAVDMQSNAISGTTAIQAIATQPLSAFNLDFAGLTISQITVNRQSASFARQGSELTITPTLALAQGISYTVTIAYAGVPTPVADPGLPAERIGWVRYPPGVFVMSEPSGAMSWFPGNNHPRDKATYTLRVTVATPYVVAANGVLSAVIDHGTTRTYLWQVNQPMASYLATVCIAPFTMQHTQGPQGLPLINFFPKAVDPARLADFDKTPAMIDYFSAQIGPFPCDSYGAIVLADDKFNLALESQGRALFGLPVAHEQVIAHELAHQWFGDSVSPATWQDVWLNEGFATYFQYLWQEHSEGAAAFTQSMAELYNYSQEAHLPTPARPAPHQLFAPTVYVRGAWVLHALRLQVGDERFFQIVRTYYGRFRYGNASTQDFIAVATEVSGQDLQAFFARWLYGAEVPVK
jgi:aminopeptidase N